MTQNSTANAAQTSRYRVGGMDCASCATKIDTAVRRMPGVADVVVSVTAGTMCVQHDASSDLAAIQKKVAGLGYTVAPLAAKMPDARVAARHERDGHDHSGHNHHDHAGHDHDHSGHSHGPARSFVPEAEGLHAHEHGPMDGPWWQSKKGQLTIASGAALVAAYAIGHLVFRYPMI